LFLHIGKNSSLQTTKAFYFRIKKRLSKFVAIITLCQKRK